MGVSDHSTAEATAPAPADRIPSLVRLDVKSVKSSVKRMVSDQATVSDQDSDQAMVSDPVPAVRDPFTLRLGVKSVKSDAKKTASSGKSGVTMLSESILNSTLRLGVKSVKSDAKRTVSSARPMVSEPGSDQAMV